MAEAREETTKWPMQGKVKEGSLSDFFEHARHQMCKQWSVHEDGVLAYKLQEEEIDHHYGMNRQNRRTVRDDIPVAKVVQTEEEIEQQKERLRKLAALQAQAEADEIVARKVNRQLQDEARRREAVRELEDEDLARLLQEKEKKKYERYLEKKRERKLKKEREKLEQQLARTTEEARLVLPDASKKNVDQVAGDLEAMRLNESASSGGSTRPANSATRVTPAGRIEDDGDFSDFYAVPPDGVRPEEWELVQQQQDEELARLLQEQEHKRSKAEVDKAKLREIEMRDEQLALIMQEQEKLKMKKYKQKRQQQKEQKRLERQLSGQEGLPLGASANMLAQLVGQEGLSLGPSAVMTQAAVGSSSPDHSHHRYRRNSYTKSIDNGPAHIEVPSDFAAMASGSPKYKTVIDVSHASSSHRQGRSGDLSPDDAPEVLRWLQSQGAEVEEDVGRQRLQCPQSLTPSPPVSHPSDEEEFVRRQGTPTTYNIAAAIDPTYHRRQQELENHHQTPVKSQIPVSRSLPIAVGPLEWEPGGQSSLRRLRDPTNPLSLDSGEATFEELSNGGGYGPVQGQKRNRKPIPAVDQKAGKGGNCKQQ
ncbi:eukaryotic translation initiation factor 5B-like isoform X2 [Pomacea canaliculata]|uniref:eukaryotic translation initiation factor 5B-like isoform X2 n=1 Tax=Pomacea canaliculata TaxID=400727 RepID=UPI000D72F20B|nr:eukaryotic translation initiation factor 5B-like isoform X2 [Pomacea canaliculata]